MAQKKPKILIVDDDEAIRRLVKKILCDELGSIFECHSVDTFEACMDFLKAGLPDLIIFDLGLPDSFGFEGLKEIHGAYPELGVVVLTGHHDGKYAARAVSEFGVLAYITKPIDIHDFYHAISDAIIRSRVQKRLNWNALIVKVMAIIGLLTALVVLFDKILGFFRG